MAIEIDNLQIRIQANADNAASAIERLKNALASLKSAVGTKGISGLNKLAENINNVGTAIAAVDIERLERFRDVVQALKGTTKIRVDVSQGAAKAIAHLIRPRRMPGPELLPLPIPVRVTFPKRRKKLSRSEVRFAVRRVPCHSLIRTGRDSLTRSVESLN